MKSIKLVAALLLLAACSPQIYTVHLDVRHPSTSGLDLSRKSMAVVYMDSPATPADSLFDHFLASEMSVQLGTDYFGDVDAVPIFHIPLADTVSLPLMRSLVMDTGEDVVFLVDSHLGEPVLEGNKQLRLSTSVDSTHLCSAAIPLASALYVYDSMGKDEVRRFNGSSTLRVGVFNNGITPDEHLKDLAARKASDASESMAQRICSRFAPTWKTEGFSFYYFEDYNANRWFDALDLAASGQFAKAVDMWTPLLKGSSELKRACASFNVALAFYMMEDLEMATRWLDQADRLENLTLSQGLRKRIAARLEK